MLGAHGRAFAFAFVATMLLVAGPAWADVRYAEPGIGGSDPACPETDPCDLQQAVESATNGDEVIVTAGTYDESVDEVTVPGGVNVHGAPGPRPTILSNAAAQALAATITGARVADLAIAYSGTSTGLRMSNGNVGERLYVKSSGTAACNVLSATLRDSVCWDTGLNGNAIFNSTSIALALTTTVRNVTAVASGANSDGIDINAQGGLTHNFDAKNVIASGVAFDAQANQDGTSTATIGFENSNYDVENPAQTGTVTDPGSGTNQTQSPAFVSAGTGDFHQAAGSPTIDAGAGDPQLGSADIDGESRSQGAAPDIGADEFTVPPEAPAANGDTFPPDTKILKGPKKRTKKRKAKFQFGGSEPGLTFECSLDDKAFKPCDSPEKYRSLKRTKHVFAVRAVDAAGNRDPTPADRKWSIRKKKK